MITEQGCVYCDCCGSEKLAQVVGDKLIIRDRRHGDKHVVSIPVSDLVDFVTRTTNNKSKEPAVPPRQNDPALATA